MRMMETTGRERIYSSRSGDKIYVKDPVTGENVLDHHGHLIVDHDLYSHDGLTPDGIAEAFIEFAKKEGLSFFR